MFPFDKNDGRYYNTRRLNQVFAISSVLLLVSVVWVVIADRDRGWKEYQREFRDLEQRTTQTVQPPPPTPAPEQTEESPFEEDIWETESAPATTQQTTVTDAAPESAPVPPDDPGWTRRVVNAVRDLPFLDFAAPLYRIDQIVVHDAPEDNNFTHTPRVDRCTTCHQGMLRPDLEDAPQPHAQHPNLDLFLDSESPHPIERFGCTVCHGGQGRGTEFISAGHTPADDAQAAIWAEKYGWHPPEFDAGVMHPRALVQASCNSCHAEQESLPGAETLTMGLHLIERAGCYACHATDKFADRPNPGPSLTKLASKSSSSWLHHWLTDPQAVSPGTWMPRFFDADTHPSSSHEIALITAYLLDSSEPDAPAPIPVEGDAVRGRELLYSVGCLGCHLSPEEPPQTEITPDTLLRKHGPRLAGLSRKTTPAWLFHWLKNPAAYDPNTPMPNLRLTDQEAADLVSYLMSVETEASNEAAAGAPSSFDAAVEVVSSTYLRNQRSAQRLLDEFESQTPEEKVMFLGKFLVNRYGCAGCHEINGVDKPAAIAPELSNFGNKTAHDFDFGAVDSIPHTKFAWVTQKIRSPRSFQRPDSTGPEQWLRMPQYAFGDSEIDAIATALFGFTKTEPANRLRQHLDDTQRQLAAGRQLLRSMNCQGCHLIEDQGGAIRPSIEETLIATGIATAETASVIAGSFSPPNLIGEGKKVQGDWLFAYLHDPATIRPWLHVRMPSFTFRDGDRERLIAYFQALDDQSPYADELTVETSGPLFEAGQKLFSPEYFDCANCHIQGDKMPSGSPDRWAPDIALSADRLRPQWVRDWLYNPQPLMPGTKMPTYFDPQYFADAGPEDILGGDEHRQIEALVNYVFAIAALPHAHAAEPTPQVSFTETPEPAPADVADPFNAE